MVETSTAPERQFYNQFRPEYQAQEDKIL